MLRTPKLNIVALCFNKAMRRWPILGGSFTKGGLEKNSRGSVKEVEVSKQLVLLYKWWKSIRLAHYQRLVRTSRCRIDISIQFVDNSQLYPISQFWGKFGRIKNTAVCTIFWTAWLLISVICSVVCIFITTCIFSNI